jgi:hypothetical protein
VKQPPLSGFHPSGTHEGEEWDGVGEQFGQENGLEPQEVSLTDATLPATVRRLMPPDTVARYLARQYSRDWEAVAQSWFLNRLDLNRLIPKPGIDKSKALRHIEVIIDSFEPRYEHKVAAVAILLEEWFTEMKSGRKTVAPK